MPGKLFTIGHSTLEQKTFIKLLRDKGVTVLADVRSTPYSRFAPQFNRETLKKAVEAVGIQYMDESEAFGARQKDKSLYSKEGYLDFDKMRARPLFKQKVSKYAEQARLGESVAFMCSEKDPLACHRSIMVARGFSLYGLPVGNILPDGKVIPQEEIDKKLLDMYFPGHDQPSLFGDDGEGKKASLLKKAYEMQNAKVGYKLADLVVSEEKQAEDVKANQWEGVNENGELLDTKDRIARFRGEHGFLSNMYDCPVEYKGVTYHSSEAAYQAQRPVKQEDRDKFTGLSGVEAKRLVDKLEGRKDWHDVNTGIMEEIVRAKFQQNPGLAKKLLDTGDRQLVEGNRWYDMYWGVCNGRGKNMLGNILMKVREELKREKGMGQDNAKDVFTVAVTGHRPHLMFGYDWNNEGNVALSNKIQETLHETLVEAQGKGYGKFHVVTGMALGTDQMFAAHAIRLAASEEFKGKLTVEAAVPFDGQEKQWPEASRKIYNTLLKACDSVHVVSDKGFSAKAMQDRNEYMVDKADVLLSVYDGVSQGGTKNCIDYAVKKNVPVRDVGLPGLLKEYPKCRAKATARKRKPVSKAQERPDEGR